MLGSVRAFNGISRAFARSVFMRERDEFSQLIRCYRNGARSPSHTVRIVVLVDDGLARGAIPRARA